MHIKVDNSNQLVQLHTLKGHDAWVFHVAWSPDSRQVASASEDRTVRLWSLKHKKPLKTLTSHTVALGVAWSPQGKYVASGSSNGAVHVWDVKSGQEVRTMMGHHNTVRRVAWSADGKQIAVAASNGLLWLWDIESADEPHCFADLPNAIKCVAWSHDGKRLATGAGSIFTPLAHFQSVVSGRRCVDQRARRTAR